MHLDLSHILALVTGVVLLCMLVFLYVRSRQGDQRVIAVANQMIFFVLAAIATALGFINPRQPISASCTGTLGAVKYIGIALTVLLVAIGMVRFFLSRTSNRDSRLYIHPLLFALMIATLTFLIEYLNGCILG